MYADVVVLTYQPPEIDSYTYQIPKNLKDEVRPGQIVKVPFGKRNPMGIVISISKAHLRGEKFPHLGGEKGTGITIKPINSILLAQPIILLYQIKLLKWMREYYIAPMVNCLEAMIPDIPRRSLIVDSSSGQKINPINDERLTINQTLVLVPSINRLPGVMAKFKRAKNYTLYHNELKKSEKFAAWLKILSGKVDFVFGARSAVFAPCPALSQIIIFDEHDNTYKDERSPYFDCLTVAEKISKLSGAKIKIYDSCPKITTYFCQKSNLTFETLKRKVELVSMAQERLAGNRSPISDKLSAYITFGVQKNKKVLLFLNKKLESGHLFCRNCQHSDFVKKQPEACPNCQSVDIYFNSLNIFSLRDLVKKIVPAININLIAEGISSRKLETSSQWPVIDIATAAILYKLLPYKYDLIAHVFVDSIAGIADFATDERTFSQITNLKKLLKETGLLLLQTYSPQNPTIQKAAAGNFISLYQSQLDLRKKLTLPPFALLVKLSLRSKKQEGVEQEAQSLVSKINHSLSTINHLPISILGPYRPVFWTSYPTYNIIIKYKLADYNLKSRERAIENLSYLLKIVPSKWQVTVEPDSLN